jgi:hypothetical protein
MTTPPPASSKAASTVRMIGTGLGLKARVDVAGEAAGARA